MNLLGETKNRTSFTTHFWQRWRQRIDPYASSEFVFESVEEMTKNGIKIPIDNLHYRICCNGICVVFMRLSPLHSLAKTVYKRDEESLSAI